MIVFAFFAAVFSSVSWLIYALMFVRAKLADSALWEQSGAEMLMYIAVVFLPIIAIWMVFGLINQYLTNRTINKKQTELLTQLQKNQDYTDLVVRVMLDAEHEIKDGFVLNKFDVFINDMNEALSEIIQRCNIASSAQLDILWQRVRRGEKWSLGKAVLEASKSQSTFDAWVKEKVNRDKVFRGALLEFCSRYQNLLQLLEKHDRDRIFLRLIETGVFGKVYSIIAPLSEGLSTLRAENTDFSADGNRDNDYAAVLKIATLEQQPSEETIINVDRNDDEKNANYINEDIENNGHNSFFARFNPFQKKKEQEIEADDDVDPFFQALHNSFQDNPFADSRKDTTPHEPQFGSSDYTSDTEQNDRPVNLAAQREDDEKEPTLSAPSFNNMENTLNMLRADNDAKIAVQQNHNKIQDVDAISDSRQEPSLSSTNTNINSSVKTEENASAEDEEDLVYPFGGWTDENNYNK